MDIFGQSDCRSMENSFATLSYSHNRHFHWTESYDRNRISSDLPRCDVYVKSDGVWQVRDQL